MSSTVSAVNVVPAPIMKQSGAVQVPVSDMQVELRNLAHFEDGTTVVNDSVDCALSRQWQGRMHFVLLTSSKGQLRIFRQFAASSSNQKGGGKRYFTSYLNYIEANRFPGIYKMMSLTAWRRCSALTRLTSGRATLLKTLRANFCSEIIQCNSKAF
ncbi:hypothetical protein TRVL_07655 [Trypanosoma vivax]|nr:hypothetical protein TRVL_07655 [Trypanosoma vivax]